MWCGLVISCILQLSKAAAERNAACRAHFQFQIGAESPDRLVFIDESRIDCRTTYRLCGWAYKGARAKVSARFVRGPGYVRITSSCLAHIIVRFSLLPALSCNGIIFSDVREGTYDGPAFVQYIEQLLPHMNPWPEPLSVLVMDNCSIHHLDDIAPLCASRWVTCLQSVSN